MQSGQDLTCLYPPTRGDLAFAVPHSHPCSLTCDGGVGIQQEEPRNTSKGSVCLLFFFYCRSVYKIRLYLPVFPPSFHLLSTPHEVGCKAKYPLAQLSGFVWCTLLTISNIRETLFVFYSKGQYWRGSCDCALYHSRNTEVFPQWTHCLLLSLPVLLTIL